MHIDLEKIKKHISGIIACLLILSVLNFFTPPIAMRESKAPVVSIEQYISENISALSPEQPVLGGTFYVTDIETRGNAGTVYYEDGHIALIADFLYEIGPRGIPLVTSFKVRK